ncbi:MAG: hypothetical protein JWP89_5214 [Schlesneria sp.]|nr:hypothetical protein [Schlesneria sp.]
MPQKLRLFIPWIGCSVGFFAITLVGEARRAEALPRYLKVWKNMYSNEEGNGACYICHTGEKKSTFNDYGMLVKEALGAKNVMDEDAIRTALKKAEKVPRKGP